MVALMNTKPQIQTAYLGIKLEPSLKRDVEYAAKREGILVSEWIRRALANGTLNKQAARTVKVR